jgi:hypothetical protein
MHIEAALSMIEGQCGAENKKELASLLNDMILHRFDLLVQLLYRVDVPEQQVKQLLQAHPQSDAGMLLAELLLQRQEQKKAILKKPTPNPTDIPEEDRW